MKPVIERNVALIGGSPQSITDLACGVRHAACPGAAKGDGSDGGAIFIY